MKFSDWFLLVMGVLNLLIFPVMLWWVNLAVGIADLALLIAFRRLS